MAPEIAASVWPLDNLQRKKKAGERVQWRVLLGGGLLAGVSRHDIGICLPNILWVRVGGWRDLLATYFQVHGGGKLLAGVA